MCVFSNLCVYRGLVRTMERFIVKSRLYKVGTNICCRGDYPGAPLTKVTVKSLGLQKYDE